MRFQPVDNDAVCKDAVCGAVCNVKPDVVRWEVTVLSISWDSESVSGLIQGTLRVGFLLL